MNFNQTAALITDQLQVIIRPHGVGKMQYRHPNTTVIIFLGWGVVVVNIGPFVHFVRVVGIN